MVHEHHFKVFETELNLWSRLSVAFCNERLLKQGESFALLAVAGHQSKYNHGGEQGLPLVVLYRDFD